MITSIIQHHRLISDFWATELKRRYAGTLLGPLWAILPPTMTIIAFWFVFGIGLRTQDTGSIPFFYYFTVGILPWFLFFDTFSTSVNTVVDNRHLITKMVFPSEVLPVIKFFVASVPHLVLLFGMCILLFFANHLATDKICWVVYFYVCTAYIALATSWLASSVSVFSRDAAPAATMVVSLVFWFTPIMWRIEVIPNEWRWLFEWNPLTYLVNGYRFALINGAQPSLESHARFWIITLFLWFIGSQVFKRLKHHFADVL